MDTEEIVIIEDKKQIGEGVKFEHDYKDESGENFVKVKNEYKE